MNALMMKRESWQSRLMLVALQLNELNHLHMVCVLLHPETFSWRHISFKRNEKRVKGADSDGFDATLRVCRPLASSN